MTGKAGWATDQGEKIYMRNMVQLIGGVAVAGAVAAGTTAFTATGLTNSAGASAFVGGSISQTVTGAALSTIAYGFYDAPANTTINLVTLTFADATAGKTPTISFTGGSGAFTCTAINASTFVSSCTPDSGNGRVGVTAVTVTVS